MINLKFRENIPVFKNLAKDVEKLNSLFYRIIEMSLRNDLNENQNLQIIIFLINSYQSLEVPSVRSYILRYVSLSIWNSLSHSRLLRELSSHPALKQHWNYLLQQEKEKKEIRMMAESASKIATNILSSSSSPSSSSSKSKVNKKKRKKSSIEESTTTNTNNMKDDTLSSPSSSDIISKQKNTEITNEELWEKTWIPTLIINFLNKVESIKEDITTSNNILSNQLPYLERCLEFLIDLLSQLPTRRFLWIYMIDIHLLERCHQSFLYQQMNNNHLFRHLLNILATYIHFEVDNHTGKAKSLNEITAERNTELQRLQQYAFNTYPTVLRDLVFSSAGELGKVIFLI